MTYAPGEQLGTYEVLELLGSGRMGEVYRARDGRLGRDVAIKVLSGVGPNEARARLWREARAGASVNHPNICQVYEVGEAGDQVFIAMELVDGRPLSARVAEGPLAVADAAQAALEILDALETLHSRGIVHRDVKPTNVFVTRHGVKLLDFGIARGPTLDLSDATMTGSARVIGTPRYMAPEQWRGDAPDSRSDLFAVGAVLFEMLTGKPAFPGDDAMAVYHAVMFTEPPALTGAPSIVALDRVIHRALEKRPEDRYQTAASMAAEIRSAPVSDDALASVRVRTTTRLIVLPFRMLRPDADLDFLTLSLPDAVTASLAGLESLVVRSPLVSAKYADRFDLSAIAADLAVDAVVFGTLLRADDQVRVSAQLVEAPSGTIVWSRTLQAGHHDIFKLQDDMAAAIVESLAIPLSVRETRRIRRDLPANARAYEFYLRANQIAYDSSMLTVAEGLYRSALQQDPLYAPAWARMGRVLRLLAKYGEGAVADDNRRQADAAFRRALELNPDSSLAHNLYTHFEVESVGRPQEAMVRLLHRAQSAPADPDLFAGLVLACRYCGLLEASIEADRQARRLDSVIRTSVMYTNFMRGDWTRALDGDVESSKWITKYTLPLIGREAEAIASCLEDEARPLPNLMQMTMKSLRLALERQDQECVDISRHLAAGRVFDDPEGLFFIARNLARVGAHDLALETLERVVDRGFFCPRIFTIDPWLDELRPLARFAQLLHRAEARSRDAAAEYEHVKGAQLLGPAN